MHLMCFVYSDRKVTEDATTDWARIDMDDYVPAPLIVDGSTHRKISEIRPGQFMDCGLFF